MVPLFAPERIVAERTQAKKAKLIFALSTCAVDIYRQ
jgi:hypothetical protein